MRVLVVTNMYPNPIRPHSGRFIQDHVRALEHLGVEVDVFFTNPKVSRTEYFTALPRLRRALAGTFDILHAQHTYCMFQLKAAATAGTGKPAVVLTCHEGEVGVALERRDPDADAIKRLTYSTSLKRRAARMADHVVAVSEEMKRQLRLGNCSVIPAAVDHNVFKPIDKTVARYQLGIEQDRLVVLFPGDRRRHQKGFDLLQEALPRLTHSVRLIVGGNIPPQDMPIYMNAADVIVQTSRYEGSPTVIKEAMACCKPIVTTNVGDVSWLLGGEPGHYVVPSEGGSIAAAVDLALDFGRPTCGRSRLQELGLTTRQTAHRYLEVYEQALRNHAYA